MDDLEFSPGDCNWLVFHSKELPQIKETKSGNGVVLDHWNTQMMPKVTRREGLGQHKVDIGRMQVTQSILMYYD